MKSGDLVKWSLSWIATCLIEEGKDYRQQIGVVIDKGWTVNCYTVVWSNGKTSDVHYDYLEALCKSVI